jgi:hypothetical protein
MTVAGLLAILISMGACSTQPHSAKGVQAAQTSGTPEVLTRKIIAILPPGWEASWDSQYRWIEVARTAETEFSGGGNYSPTGGPFKGKYKIGLPVRDFMQSEEYRRLSTENCAIRAALQKLEAGMQAIARRGDAFAPVNPEQMARVDAYETVKKQIHPLPDYYFRDVSLDWLSPETQKLALPTDATVRGECEQVCSNIQKLLSTYPMEGK